MIVVLDTNIWISGILWSGPPHEIILRAERAEFSIASSKQLIGELFGVLARAKFVTHFIAAHTDLARVRTRVMKLTQIYVVRHTIITIITADPPDNAVLACALSAKAGAIVSGDDHLLALQQFRGIPILTPRQFLAKFEALKK